MNGFSNGNNPQQPAVQPAQVDKDGWSLGGTQFRSPREVYSRSLFRICLKFTTSEDEDEGKPEPATAFWTLYGRETTIGNNVSDSICRKMDDSMTGAKAGSLSRLTDRHGPEAAQCALAASLTTGWHIEGSRGDAAIRVGKAKILNSSSSTSNYNLQSLDATRWKLVVGASFAAGNSVFTVEEVTARSLKIQCNKGPMRGKLVTVTKTPYVFGRAHEADLCIMDRELSRRHGAILYHQNQFILTDLESTVS